MGFFAAKMKTEFTDKEKSLGRRFMNGGGIYVLIFGTLCLFEGQTGLRAQGTAFTYQGSLTVAGAPANGQYDLSFGLYSTNSGGNPTGTVLTNGNLTVSNGLFTTVLDFGPVFDGTAYWLEIGVRASDSTNDLTILCPRQALNSSPYAVYAVNAGTITGSVPSAALTSVPAGNLTGSVPSGTLPANLQLLNTNNAINLTNIQASALPANLQVLNANNAVNLTNIQATALPIDLQVLSTNDAVNLTNIPAGQLTGSVPSATLTSVPAGNLTGSVPNNTLTIVPAGSLIGSIPTRSLPANVQTLNDGDAGNLTNVQAAALPANLQVLSTNDAVNLTNIPASQLTGSVPSAILTSVPAGNLTGSVPSGTLTSVPAGNLVGSLPSGTVPANLQVLNTNNAINLTNIQADALPANLQVLSINDAVNLTNVQATALPVNIQILNTNNAVNLTNIPAHQLTGSVPSATLTLVPAGNLIGSVPTGSLPANVQTLNNGDAGNLTNVQAGALPANLQVLSTNDAVNLTNIPASQLTGSVPSATLTSVPAGNLIGTVPSGTLTSVPAGNLTGSVPSGTLTSIPAGNLAGTVPSGTLPANLQVLNANNALNLTNVSAANLTGTAPDGVLSTNIPRLNSRQTFTGVNTFGSGTDTTTNIIETGNFPFELGNGAWFTAPVPFFRPTTTNTSIAFDIMPNGTTADTWIDICSTDDYVTQGGIANSEHLHLAKYANGYASISCFALGSGVVRDLELQEDGGYVGVNTPNPLNEFQVHGGVNVNAGLGVGNASTNARLAAFNDNDSANIDLEFQASGYHWLNSGPLTQVMGLMGSNLFVLGALTSTNGFIEQVRTMNGSYSAVLSDSCIYESAITNTLITLPAPAGNPGKAFTVKNTGTATCTITNSAGIDHATSKAISTQDSSVTFRSDGAIWQIQSAYVGGSSL